MSNSVIVEFGYFQGYVGGNSILKIDADSFEEVLQIIDNRYPGFKNIILRGDNKIRNSIAVKIYNEERNYISSVYEISQKFHRDLGTIYIKLSLQDLGGG